jgi:phenylacetate-CoA ligase
MHYSDVEHAPPAEMRQLQGERLADVVAYVHQRVPFYRERLDEAGVDPDAVSDIEDVERLPFTTKEDFRDTYPDGLFAVDRSEMVCVHASSGTTGKPKLVGYTRSDMDLWREVMARCLVAAGVDENQTVQNAYGYGLFTGGLGVHHGCDELGANVVPIGGGNTGRQLQLLADLGSETLTCTPSYALYLAEEAERREMDLASLPLSTVVFGAEPCTDPMREAIEERLDVTGVDIYGLSEVIGPGVSIECAEAQDGLHVQEDVFYPEVIDPETGEVLPDGEEGELVLTTLTKEGLPVLRYRTGDLTALMRGECACGRTTVRMDNVTGRVDDMVTVRGVNLYPSQVEAAVLGLDGVAPHYRLDLYRRESLDRIEVTVEREAGSDVRAVERRVEGALADTLDFTPDDLRVVDPGGVERQETGKVQRVFDHR